MAQETLKITITADNQQAVKNIQETVTATTNLGNAFKKLPSSSGRATQALTDLSRVAQDAPYGFMGIANNINPLLESFQRLQASAGSTGGALKAMASGLMGPAGLGLAVGAVSSLIVAFGPKIMDYINGTNEATKAQKKFAEGLREAQAEAGEMGVKLGIYLKIAEDANVSDKERAKALGFVKDELGKVNKAYANSITTVGQAKDAVKLYTEALVAQAVTSRYIDLIADKNIALADAQKKAMTAGEEYVASLARSKSMVNGYVDASVTMAATTGKAKDEYLAAGKAVGDLQKELTGLNNTVESVIKSTLKNPFDNSVKTTTSALKEQSFEIRKNQAEIEAYIREANAITRPTQAQRRKAVGIEYEVKSLIPPEKLGKNVPSFATQYEAQQEEKRNNNLDLFNQKLQFAQQLSNDLANGFTNVFDAMANGESVGAALESMFKNMAMQLTQMVIQALLFKAIMSAFGLGGVAGGGGGLFGGLGKIFGFANGGIVSKPTFAMVGEGGESEAIMPLSKLDAVMGNAFASGAASGGGVQNGSFVLRGQDLVLALQRSNVALNLRR